MPSIATPSSQSRRRPRFVESDDDDEDQASRLSPGDSSTPFTQTTPNGSKRARLDGDEDASTDSPGPTQPLPIRSPRTSRTIGANTSANGIRQPNETGSPDEHRPGAIVRVKLTDFVTYTLAEFFPGPRLNMVIGPNGTGKSTLVCAICLGLGWPPSILGRAKDPGEFVKHGCDEAIIEIELKGDGRRFRRNPVITRTIKRDGNKSAYALNGKPLSKTKVQELAREFSIQVDNLCQFLPQDKVAEFAALTPIQLLYSTQRAAGGKEMVDLHDGLKNLRAEQKDVQEAIASGTETLRGLEQRQEMQREDVERMRQRAQIKKRIDFLEKARPIPVYRQIHEEYKELRDRNKTLRREHDELKLQVGPVLKSVDEKNEYREKIEIVVKQRRPIFSNSASFANQAFKKMEVAEDKLKDLNSQIEGEKKSIGTDVEQIKKLQQIINRLKRQRDEGAPDYDPDRYSEKIKECTRLIREAEEKAGEIQNRKRDQVRNIQIKKNILSSAQEELRGLASQTGQQEEKLRMLSRDSHQAWKWIKDNQNRFEKRVYGPPMVECSVTNPQYADAIESLLQRNEFVAFTTQSREDFRTLQKALYNELKLHDVTIKTCSIALSELRSPMSDEDLRRFGFDGWARDFMTGPEQVLAMLCSENRLHQTPLVLRDISDDEYRKMESSQISSWVAGRQSYQVIRRREYGPGATSTKVRQLRKARVWTDQPIDASRGRELENKISQTQQAMNSIVAMAEEDKNALGQLHEERNNAAREKDDLEREKSAKQSALTIYNALPVKISQSEGKMQTVMVRKEGIRKRIGDLRDKQDEVFLEKAAAAMRYASMVRNLRETHEQLIYAEIKLIEASSDYEVLNERNNEVNRILEEKEEELTEVAARLAPIAAEVRRARDDAQVVMREATSNLSPELATLLECVKGYSSVAQLEADLDSEKARLELTGQGSSAIIREFEDRQREIDSRNRKLAKEHKQLDEFKHAIKETRELWEPQLDALVRKISEAFSDSFSRIGCAGQVSVDKATDVVDEDGNHNTANDSNGNGNGNGDDDDDSNDSDFDQWSIKIEVKFREHETLSVLDAHRQSGGERAVSTIFYLMALQSLSASPFRVVDEINQGMDPRNERMVHERMVDIACGRAESGDAGGQYFLITPKLLSGLAYKRGMKVLCIASGEYMPEDHEKLDFRRCVAVRKEVLRGRERRMGKGKERMVGDVGVEA